MPSTKIVRRDAVAGQRLLGSVPMLTVLASLLAGVALPARAATGAPIPVIPTDVAAPSQLVQIQALITVTSGFGNGTIYTVPAGKRLVIETMSATTETLSNAPNPYTVLVVVNNFSAFAAFPIAASGGLAAGTTAAHLYADAGSQVLGRVFGRTTASDTVGVGIVGYLVDAPAAAVTSKSSPPLATSPGMATLP